METFRKLQLHIAISLLQTLPNPSCIITHQLVMALFVEKSLQHRVFQKYLQLFSVPLKFSISVWHLTNLVYFWLAGFVRKKLHFNLNLYRSTKIKTKWSYELRQKSNHRQFLSNYKTGYVAISSTANRELVRQTLFCHMFFLFFFFILFILFLIVFATPPVDCNQMIVFRNKFL